MHQSMLPKRSCVSWCNLLANMRHIHQLCVAYASGYFHMPGCHIWPRREIKMFSELEMDDLDLQFPLTQPSIAASDGIARQGARRDARMSPWGYVYPFGRAHCWRQAQW
jgi:hypothetical protein